MWFKDKEKQKNVCDVFLTTLHSSTKKDNGALLWPNDAIACLKQRGKKRNMDTLNIEIHSNFLLKIYKNID